MESVFLVLVAPRDQAVRLFGGVGVIRVAVIGTGAVTEAFAAAVRGTPGIEVEGVVSRDLARARRHADSVEAPCAWNDIDVALNSSCVDAVYIASPHVLHVDHALRTIRAGRHVLVEKPAALTEREWSTLIAESARRRVVCMEAMRTAYDPGTDLLRQRIRDLGQIERASLAYEKHNERYADRDRVGDPTGSPMRSALLEVGVYLLHAMVGLFGPPQAVVGAYLTSGDGVDVAGTVLATYNGFITDLRYSQTARRSEASAVRGAKGTVTVDHIQSPRRITTALDEGLDRTDVVDEPPDSLQPEVQRFVEAIDRRVSLRHDHALTAHTTRLLETLRDQHKLGTAG